MFRELQLWLPLFGILPIFYFGVSVLLHYRFKEMTKATANFIMLIGALLIVYFYACCMCYS